MKLFLFLSLIFLSSLFSAVIAEGQILRESSFKLERTTSTSSSITPLSNSVTDIVVSGTTIWLGTGKGLSRSTDGGVTWTNYYGQAAFGEEDVSAIAIHNNEVWVATAHDTTVDGSSLPVGSGLRYSSDWGETWAVIPQPRDFQNIDTLFYNSKSTILALGVTTNVNNITYDIAATDSAVWIASYAGMARKSTNKGKTWQVVIIPPDNLDSISLTDSLVFDVSPVAGNFGLTGSLNHRAFSVYAENWSHVWIGTAGGINRTTDGGQSWVKFNHINEASPISGNFVVALRKQTLANRAIMWAATVNADDPSEKRGVSFSADSGQTWKTSLIGEFCHNLGFKDSIVYAVTDDGIFRSSDDGTTWSQPGTIYDDSTKQQITSPQFYAVDTQGENVWFGGADGAVRTQDNSTHLFGSSWSILHAAQPLSSSRSTYAYPNPFSPANQSIRLHYPVDQVSANVTIRIFDFGMSLVRTVISDASRGGIAEHDEIWDGKNDKGRQVSNGPYFYEVVVGTEKPIWGKILVLQ